MGFARRFPTPSLPATNAKRLRKGATRRSNPFFFPRRDGLLRCARNGVERLSPPVPQNGCSTRRSGSGGSAEAEKGGGSSGGLGRPGSNSSDGAEASLTGARVTRVAGGWVGGE